MGWHSDDEELLGKNNTIASSSLEYNENSHLSISNQANSFTITKDGSLLMMKDATQSNWLHNLPKSKNITQSRINLTFRTG